MAQLSARLRAEENGGMFKMPRVICPCCRKVYSVSPHIGDFICNCGERGETGANEQEDVLELGPWEDFTGSGGGKTNFYRGAENKLKGTVAEIEGGDVDEVTARGNKAALYRQRPKQTYIKLD